MLALHAVKVKNGRRKSPLSVGPIFREFWAMQPPKKCFPGRWKTRRKRKGGVNFSRSGKPQRRCNARTRPKLQIASRTVYLYNRFIFPTPIRLGSLLSGGSDCYT